MLEFCKTRPDLVVSGINDGANTGINVLYSGTVAGAIEGAFFGVTSVAVSLARSARPNFGRAARLAVGLIEQLHERHPQPGSLWNVNFSPDRPGCPLGVKTTVLGVKRHLDVMEKRTDPRGGVYFWSGLDPIENHQMNAGTDIKELSEGYATITPMHFDLTDAPTIETLNNTEWRPLAE